MKTKTITFTIEGWEIERMRTIINALKNFNRQTDDKCDISYNIISELDGADNFLANRIGLEQDEEEGRRNWYSDYTWLADEDDEV